jgi:hypothetical protein
MNYQKVKFTKSEILTDVSVIYTDDFEERFEAIKVTNSGYILGRIFKENMSDVFIAYGYIPKRNIKHIKWDIKKKIKKED